MTGQDLQDRLDAIIEDLQTKGKGQTVQIMFRDNTNSAFTMPLSSDANGVVNAAQLNQVQIAVDALKPFADEYEDRRGIYEPLLEAYQTARAVHQPLIDAYSAARTALQDAFENDVNYQNAKTALNDARLDPDYVAAVQAYKIENVSENYQELQAARGKYNVV